MTDANKTIAEGRDKIDRVNQQLSDYEAEIGQLRRRVDGLETDRIKDKQMIDQLQENLSRSRAVGGYRMEDAGPQRERRLEQTDQRGEGTSLRTRGCESNYRPKVLPSQRWKWAPVIA